ncbi:uncharacterized protein LOC110988506 isoform X2 [Acanthaster planci]|uniref:Uncharacterized protein LOC110988506 isoform X2 n=1 Tax=Acanthaster planci TaxID=133434 RepID=A0A8B7ZQB4_ACAPL|nr:uncharacterized protein LOC110988506 isoform X2 [Acanthaster planci]
MTDKMCVWLFLFIGLWTRVYAYRSCQEWRLAGYEDDGVYRVDPDGPGGLDSFDVECEMETGSTVVHHDEDVMGFEVSLTGGGGDTPNYEDPGAYRKILNYTSASLPQIVALTNASDQCSQMLSFKCRRTELWNELGTQMTWWVSRDREKMSNWGGAPSRFEGCGCYVNNGCENGLKCNCDNDNPGYRPTWRWDEGPLTDMSKLPVTEVRVGDVGSPDERAQVSVGPLRCRGVPGLFRNCEELRLDGRRTNDYYRIDPDGDGPLSHFMVWCTFSDDKAVTIIHHEDDHDNIFVSGSDGRDYEAPGAYSRKMSYDAPSISHVVALINTSTICRQHIWYKCRLAAIWRGDQQVTWLTSRDNEKMPNWGGAPSDWKGCKCSINNACVGGGRCNCDRKVENMLRFDEGYLQDEAQLPVTAIHIGDIGETSGRARFNIGALECWGVRNPYTEGTTGLVQVNCLLLTILLLSC